MKHSGSTHAARRPRIRKFSTMNKIDLNGRCAVVTGGAQGFGRAITERFVASGAKVAIWDHDLPFAEKTAKEIGAGVTAFKVDVSDLAAVEKTTRRHAEGARQDRHSGQQCRHRRHQQDGMGNRPRRMAQGVAHQSRRALYLLQGDRALDGQAEIRPHRQHRLDRRQGRQPQRGALLGVQGRPDRADEIARQGTRRATISPSTR